MVGHLGGRKNCLFDPKNQKSTTHNSVSTKIQKMYLRPDNLIFCDTDFHLAQFWFEFSSSSKFN